MASAEGRMGFVGRIALDGSAYDCNWLLVASVFVFTTQTLASGIHVTEILSTKYTSLWTTESGTQERRLSRHTIHDFT
jgi:hypothetical protein